MPEYLAPGVYVEETSFRAKSIEGVGTSTAAFVGPARKGPIVPAVGASQAATFELLTSFGDFVRIYGGLKPLGFAADEPNYLAHGVLNFFNEGGRRLYVARVATGGTLKAAEARLAGTGPGDAERVYVRARFKGADGNGRVTVREILSPANLVALQKAPAGALLRSDGGAPSEPARLSATQAGPYAVPNGARLRLVVSTGAAISDTIVDLNFAGRSTELEADTALAAGAINIPVGGRSLTVTLDGTAQNLVLEDTYPTHADLVFDLNQKLVGGYVRLNVDKLVVGTDRRGHAGTVQVGKHPELGFLDSNKTETRVPGTNNVANLASVTDADVNAIITDLGGAAAVTASMAAGRLVLATTQAGAAVKLRVADATGLTPGLVSAHAGLRLPVPGPGEPAAQGSNTRLYQKQTGTAAEVWQADDHTVLSLPADNAVLAGNLLTLSVLSEDANEDTEVFDEVSLVKTDSRYLGTVLPSEPSTRDRQLQQGVWFDLGSGVDSRALHAALFPPGTRTGQPADGYLCVHSLTGGDDGTEPQAGASDQAGSYAAALEHLLALEDVSMVAAPGHSAFDTTNYQAIQGLLRSHAERPRAYRIVVLDTPPNLTPSLARQERARIDSTRAALYYPWVTVANPLARPGKPDIAPEINLPPSAFICGIYARNDVEHSVSKAPANEVVQGALRFERDVNFAENQLLNPLGVNCLRYFPGRGYRVWGARTASSDPEWKYVNVRRFFNYLEASIDRGTQWAVFESNGERLWANVHETIEAFLYNEWVSGNLLGESPKEAFFVRCDRSTMTQNDLDNGRLICLIGVAALKPAEFVIFRIGQKTADARG